MTSVVKNAKTIEEAISLGLSELGVEKEEVNIEVLKQPTKRLFGLMGTTDAEVKLTITNDPVTMADNFLKEVFEKMNIKGTFKIERKKNDLFIDITDINSVDKGIIIGKRGNTLDSLQYILSLALNKDRSKYIRIVLDTGNYRDRREETLVELAHKMASKAKTNKRPIKLEPMSPYERRIIHAALQNQSDISTYSEGEDPYRRIVIESK